MDRLNKKQSEVCVWRNRSSDETRLVANVSDGKFYIKAVFENMYFTFFSDFKKTRLFNVFFK